MAAQPAPQHHLERQVLSLTALHAQLVSGAERARQRPLSAVRKAMCAHQVKPNVATVMQALISPIQLPSRPTPELVTLVLLATTALASVV